MGLAAAIAMLIGLIALCIKKLSGWALALTAGGLLTLSPYFLAMSRVTTSTDC